MRSVLRSLPRFSNQDCDSRDHSEQGNVGREDGEFVEGSMNPPTGVGDVLGRTCPHKLTAMGGNQSNQS